jgi:uroporphyrinogen decarboxylase
VFDTVAAEASLTHKERVDRALAGRELDRPPFTLYHHYKRPTASLEAADHLAFHRDYRTDIVKVMNDFAYPASETGRWWELRPLDSPYPRQLETLRQVRDGLNGDAYFIDTLYGPYMTAMILFASLPEYKGLSDSDPRVIGDLAEFQHRQPDAWHGALEAITQSTVNHIRRSKETGASGALVSIFNAHSSYGTTADYERFSRPYDKRVLEALADTRLTFLHLHNLDRSYLDQFRDFPAPVIQYSVKTSGIPVSELRRRYPQAIAGGVDEIGFRSLTVAQMRAQWQAAREEAGPKYIATPGCSVPNDSTPGELARFPEALGA